MTFPLVFLLIPYGLFLLGWLYFSLVAFYHILKFGFKNITTFSAAFVYVVVAVVILMFCYIYITRIDWTQPVTILGGIIGIEISI